MTDFEFDELDGGDEPSSSETGSSTERTSTKQLHVKGRYGTKTYTNDEGCYVCGRNADALLLVGVASENPERIPKRVIQICDNHEGDVMGDLKYPPEVVKRLDY